MELVMHPFCSAVAARRVRSFAMRGSFAAVIGAALIGPPHLRVRAVTPGESPARNAVLIITGEHHSEVDQLTITGRAETMRNGERVARPLAMTRLPNGQYTVARQWAAGAPSVLVFTAEQGAGGTHGIAEAMVKIDAAGQVVSIEHPQPGWLPGSNTPRRLSASELTAALQSLSRPH